MSRLLIYISEAESFDVELVRNFLRTAPGIYNVTERPDDRALLMAQFDFGADSTIFELKADMETAAIAGTGDASLRLCLLFQDAYPKPLHVIDDCYCFDFVIANFRSVDELREAMSAAAGGAE